MRVSHERASYRAGGPPRSCALDSLAASRRSDAPPSRGLARPPRDSADGLDAANADGAAPGAVEGAGGAARGGAGTGAGGGGGRSGTSSGGAGAGSGGAARDTAATG